MHDLTYLLMHTWPTEIFLANYPGRKYLFDLGTSTFDTSLRFLTDTYHQVRRSAASPCVCVDTYEG